MKSEKVVSFEKEKERLELENCKYEGTVTIYIEGKSFEDAMYYYELEYIETNELIDFFQVILNNLVEDFIRTSGSLKIQESIEPLLNKTITIDYYSSQHNSNKFFFEHAPEEITYTQLIVILNSCIANLRQE